MFHVEWIPNALDDLARIWNAAGSAHRREITNATNGLDAKLRSSPFADSESRPDGSRVLFEYPLGAQVEVDDAVKVVWVLHVWRYRRRNRP